ncbi:DoxX family protein [Nitrogeniibacter mangrovi]|uniref:DoxX family protein n=1 Tax=Nitrogeniibacter mangrovi TaxID=2016596 RepID=A0A6C1B4E4_9RHOO|nr:DoxX family protein [Nitrogeniibacter mangrovi]QID18367.1 DoxX family protein [Nitrogeniibacter mangrovi]
MTTPTRTAPDYIATTGRALLAAIFLISGVGKLAAPAGTIGYIASAGLPFPELAYAGAVFVEVILALALLVGYRTRLSAALIAAFTLVTAFAFHFHLGDQNQFIHFFKNIAIAGGLLQIVAFGGGALSLDARRTA